MGTFPSHERSGSGMGTWLVTEARARCVGEGGGTFTGLNGKVPWVQSFDVECSGDTHVLVCLEEACSLSEVRTALETF
jgi:hypothetical protein